MFGRLATDSFWRRELVRIGGAAVTARSENIILVQPNHFKASKNDFKSYRLKVCQNILCRRPKLARAARSARGPFRAARHLCRSPWSCWSRRRRRRRSTTLWMKDQRAGKSIFKLFLTSPNESLSTEPSSRRQYVKAFYCFIVISR